MEYSEYEQVLLNTRLKHSSVLGEEALRETSEFSLAWSAPLTGPYRHLACTAPKNNPLTSSEASASSPDEDGGLDTSDQNCSYNCLGALRLLCSPWKPPKAGAARESRGRWSWCCGDVLPLIRCHASWSFYTWSAYSETIFSPKKRKCT